MPTTKVCFLELAKLLDWVAAQVCQDLRCPPLALKCLCSVLGGPHCTPATEFHRFFPFPTSLFLNNHDNQTPRHSTPSSTADPEVVAALPSKLQFVWTTMVGHISEVVPFAPLQILAEEASYDLTVIYLAAQYSVVGLGLCFCLCFDGSLSNGCPA